jgi:hypothetical protein
MTENPAVVSDRPGDKEEVSTIIDRTKQARKYLKDSLWDELTEVYRALKCRTKPIYKLDDSGQETKEEDKTRTNVAMPDLNLIWRRNVARMTAQPYRLRYTGGKDPLLAPMLTALAMQQYALSDEAIHDVRVNMMGEAFGFGYSKLYWDFVEKEMKFRRALLKNGKVVYRDRKSIMAAQGAPHGEIAAALHEYGPEMSDEEVTAFSGRTGTEIIIPERIRRYEGPCLKSIFTGDLLLEPNSIDLNSSSFVIETYEEDEIWLKKMQKITYEDDDGQTCYAFDPKACKELLEMNHEPEKNQPDDLKRMFEGAVGRIEDEFPRRLRGRKKFGIIEQHLADDNGRIWISYVNESLSDKPLGRMPYPWDLYGKWAYNEYVPLPDFISPHGDSTPRLLRYLHSMHNLTVAQNFDYVSNTLQRLVKVKDTADFEFVHRGRFRELRLQNLNDVDVMDEPGLPPGAFEREAQILRMMALAEPSLNTVDQGTASNPMAGKLATTAMLNAKALDSLTQFKLDGRNRYLREVGQKKLWMNQQAATEKWEIDSQFWNEDLRKSLSEMDPQALAEVAIGYKPPTVEGETVIPGDDPKEWALSSRYGKTAAVRLDPLEIQEDLQVEPEAGSYLAVDDEIRKADAMDLEQVAAAMPDVVDRRKVARFHLSTIRNIGNPDEYILPENPNPAPPFKGLGGNISIPFDKLPHDVQNQLLQSFGLQPSEELAHRDTLEGLERLDKAATAVTNLTGPAVSEQEENQANRETKAKKPPPK